MGLYIPNIEMPKSCDDCPHPTCTLWQSVNGGERNEKCPIVPVFPHGDLIDRDKLEKDIDKYIGGEESRSRFHHWVQVQRTVIPESEEAHT